MLSIYHLGSILALLKNSSIVFEAVQKPPSIFEGFGHFLPVSILSIVSTTNFASSILKHIGGLNFSTFLPGPSVLSRIYFSLSLERAITKNYVYLYM